MAYLAVWLQSTEVVWLDIIGLATGVSMLEAAAYGRGRTVGKGRVSSWLVPAWLRPVLVIVGLGLLTLEAAHFLWTFYLRR